MIKKLRKINLIIIITAVNMMLCGCYAQREPQNRNYIMCMGIDVTDEGWQIAYGFPDLSALTGTNAGAAEPGRVVEGNSLRACAAQLNAASDKIADYSQMAVIILGESVIHSKEKLAGLIQELLLEKAVKRTVMIGQAEGKAEDILQLDEKVNGSIGVFIYELCQNNYEDKGYDVSVLEDFAGGRSSEKCVIPVFQVQEDRPVLIRLEKPDRPE